jgi:murein DD-endopeptidase MepM/ murein hydrolase activator NlpD
MPEQRTGHRARRGRRVLQSAMVGLSLLLVPAEPSAAGTEPKTPAPTHDHVHRIKAGDTLSTIAHRYGVTITALVAANHLPHRGIVIRVGQQLVIPPPLRIADLPPASPPRPRVVISVPPPKLMLRLPDIGDQLPLFFWPVQGAVTSHFGLRRSGWHTGIDIKSTRGTPIAASAPGVVIANGFERGYGNVVRIGHMNGFVTVYAHNERNLVRLGDRVMTGETVATIGRSGRATGDHVHFEIRYDGLTYNPLHLLTWPAGVAVVNAHESSHDDPSL